MRSPTLTERKPPPTGVVIGPLSAIPFRRIESRTSLGQRVAVVLVHHVGARLLDVPVELDAGGLEHAARRLGELGAGAVAGDQGHAMRHTAADCMRAVAGPPVRYRPATRRDHDEETR